MWKEAELVVSIQLKMKENTQHLHAYKLTQSSYWGETKIWEAKKELVDQNMFKMWLNIELHV